MKTVEKEKAILKIRDLPDEQVQKVSDFIDELTDDMVFQEDDDVGLEEDIADFDRILESVEKSGGKTLIPFEEMRRRLGLV